MDHRKQAVRFLIFASLVVLLQACSGSSSNNGGGTATGTTSVSLIDAPGDFDHVYITVKSLWFHTDPNVGPMDSAWVKRSLSTPQMIDLLDFSNGAMSELWSNIHLPIGTYQQIRVELEPTYKTGPPSGHLYFNEVVTNGTSSAPLRIPDAEHGIKLTGLFAIAENTPLRLAIDFNAAEDIIDIGNGREFILKPRLNYFDLDHAGAIIGTIDSGGTGTFITDHHFVIKAERLATAQEMLDSGSTNTFYVVRRWTVPRAADGSFILYPVSTRVTNTWDIVVRGLDHQTVVIKDVPVTKGTTTANVTSLGTITMTAATNPDFETAATITSPTGAWVQYYQRLPGEQYAHEIRFRHFPPLTGVIQNFELSNEPLQAGTYTTSLPISLSTATAQEGVGGFQAVAGAILYTRSTTASISSASTDTVVFSPLSVMSGWAAHSISGVITMGSTTLPNGKLFVVRGGMIVNTMDVSSQMSSMMTRSYTMPNLPGGHPFALYGVEAVGWSATKVAVAVPAIADLSTGDASSVNMNMIMLP